MWVNSRCAIAAWLECFQEKPRTVSEWTGLPGEESALSGPTDWIQRYIKPYLLHNVVLPNKYSILFFICNFSHFYVRSTCLTSRFQTPLHILLPTYSSSLLITSPYGINFFSCTFFDIPSTFVVTLILSFLILSIFVTPTHPSQHSHFCQFFLFDYIMCAA